ncbi:MAG: GGDEF domain-containing protein [Clostridiales bacterium]|nr:GGDEF domain-containing protein [Clostridiales bacterium]
MSGEKMTQIPGIQTVRSESAVKSRRWSLFIVRSCYFAGVFNLFFMIALWYILFSRTQLISHRHFWLNYVVLATLAMLLGTFVADRIIRSNRFSVRLGESVSVLLLLFFSLLLCLLHNTTAAILACYIIPVLVSTVYSNTALTRNTFILALVLLVLSSAAVSRITTRDYGFWLLAESWASLGLLVVSYLLSHVLIMFGEEGISVRVQKLILETQLMLDSLTNLYNRRAYVNFAPTIFEQCKANKSPLFLAEIDIDDFKQINDTHGHAAGDRTLQIIADMIRGIVPHHVYAFRYGGEEIVLLFEGFELSGARAACEKLLESLRSTQLMETGGEKVTASCGLAELKPEMTELSDLFQAADDALYVAKKSGKDQIVVR